MDATSHPTSPARLPRVDSAVALPSKAREMALQHMNQRRQTTLGRLSAAITPDNAIFDDTHSRTYFSLQSASEDVIYHSQAEYIEAQGQRAAPRVSSPVTVTTHGQTYENLPTKADRSYMTSPTGENIYHSRAECLEAQRATSRVSSAVAIGNDSQQTHANLPSEGTRSYTTSSTGETIYHSQVEWVEAQGTDFQVSSSITLDSFFGQTYDNLSPFEISRWSTHESDQKLSTFNDHKIMFEIFEKEKGKWSLHGQTLSNLPTSSSDLPPWSIYESERKLCNFDTHRRYMKQESDSGYEADAEDNTDIDPLPKWFFSESSRQNFDLQRHTRLSQIFEAEKELLKAEERLRAIEEKIRFILAERDADPVISAQEEQQLLDAAEETEFEEFDFFEQLQDYQPSPDSSPYSAPHDSDFSAASEMPSMTSDHGSVTTEDEKDSSPVAVAETNVSGNVEIGEGRETSVSSD